MRRSALVRLATVVVPLVVGGLTPACSSLECGAGTHEENGACLPNVPTCSCGPGTRSVTLDGGCTCVPSDDGCVCGPGTVRVPTDGGCECASLPRLPGVRACGCMIRPANFCNIMLPAPCVVETEYPALILATASDSVGGHFLVGGDGVGVRVDGGTPEVYGLRNPFHLDGEAAWVPLAVDTDGTFATAPGERVFQWDTLEIPGQPPLPLRGVSVTGELDWTGRLVQGGSIVGCFTLADAAAISIEVLSQTMADVTTGAGAVPDCDATGSGSTDGYTLELKWVAGEPFDLVP